MILLDVNTLEYDLPTHIAGYTVSNPDSSYTIILNARLTFERRLQAYWHEVNHISNGDYDRQCSADLVEMAAHN